MTPTADAAMLDHADDLRALRADFHIPTAASIAQAAGGTPIPGDCIYMCGNSLGLMPRRTPQIIAEELNDWTTLAVAAHTKGTRPWLPYHERLREPLARLLGAMPSEVVAMNSLTVNLHLLMASFYRPKGGRTKILIEDSAFPSDSYAVQSQAAWHGLDPRATIIRLRPRDGEATLSTEDIERVIAERGGEIALVLLGAVNYLTGQWFDMQSITSAARRAGCAIGWDLAHAAGNVPMHLHDWDADFAAWCSYKYLNSGPGAIAGTFVHERHHRDKTLPRLAGWWGNDPATRFVMKPDFDPVASADAWQLSNPPILSAAPLIASLELFDRAGIAALRRKSEALTAMMEAEIQRSLPGRVRILTPTDAAQRGCQLSLSIEGATREIEQRLARRGVVIDYREPGIIRAAPVPLYNTFADVQAFVTALAECLRES